MKKLGFAFLVIILLIIPLWTNLVALSEQCINSFDFGIYFQGMIEIAQGHWNPYVTVRGVTVFQDHFNPAIYLGALWVKLFSLNIYSAIFWEWLWWLASYVLLIYLVKPQKIKDWVLISVGFLFSRGLLSALHFPIHVEFWSAPIWIWWVYSLWNNQLISIFISSVFLCMFKESYPVALMLFSFSQLYLKRWILGSSLLTFSIFWTLLAFIWRPDLVGPLHDHGKVLFNNLFQQPFTFAWEIIRHMNWKMVLDVFLAPLVFIYLSREKKTTSVFLQMCTALIPLLGLQFLAKDINNQYAYLFSISLLTLAVLSINFKSLNIKKTWIVVILFIASSSSFYTNDFRFIFSGNGKNCRVSQNKIIEQNKIINLLDDKIPIQDKIAATGGIAIHLLTPSRQVFHLYSFSEIQDEYQWLVLERNAYGDAYPASPAEVEALIFKCQAWQDEIIWDSEFYFVARGRFPSSCIYEEGAPRIRYQHFHPQKGRLDF